MISCAAPKGIKCVKPSSAMLWPSRTNVEITSARSENVGARLPVMPHLPCDLSSPKMHCAHGRSLRRLCHEVYRRKFGNRSWHQHHRTPVRSPGYLLLERSEEHTSELQSLMRISYAVFCLKKKTKKK